MSEEERIVYVQDDRFQAPDHLLHLTHEELQKRIQEFLQKDLERKRASLLKMSANIGA